MADEPEGQSGDSADSGPVESAAEAVDTIVQTAEEVAADAVVAVADIVEEVPAVEADALKALQGLVKSLGDRVEELASKVVQAPVQATEAALDASAEAAGDLVTAPAETIIEAPVNVKDKGKPRPKRLWRRSK